MIITTSITETVMKRVLSPLRISSGPKNIAMQIKYNASMAGNQTDFFIFLRFSIF